MADCMQFLMENRLNRCQIFGRFGLLKIESEPNFGFPYIPSENDIKLCYCIVLTVIQKL